MRVTQLLEVEVAGGGRLIAEVDDRDATGGELVPASPTDALIRARLTLEEALDGILPPLTVMVGRLRAAAPTELEVSFGIKLSAETGIIVAKGSAEVNFDVKLVWKKEPSA
jgi:Trypsin-co-occurring domain 1